jgi:hypothetical protein
MTTLATLCVILTVDPTRMSAQASLAAEDMIDEIPVTIAGVRESFTVVRDAFRKEQWYYVPDRPRLFERTLAGGPVEPDFTLIRYQFNDPENPEKPLEGGLLQFAFTLSLPAEAVPQLKAAISETKQVPAEKIRLAALPFDSTTVHLYVPESGQLIASTPQGPGIAATFATQKVVYSVPLTRIGSDVFAELTTGNTGLAVGVEFNYNGLTPPAGFTLSVDWEQAYQHYSKDEQFRAKAGMMGYFGAKFEADRTKILDELTRNKVIEIDIIEGSNFKSEDAAKYIDAILNRINKELLEEMVVPDSIEPAKAADASGAGKGFLDKLKGAFGGSAGYSVALKNQREVKRGRERITFKTRELQTRRTVAGGFVGIGRYPEDVRNRLVTIVPPGPWKSAFFLLPNVGDAQQIGIRQVDLQIRLKHRARTHLTQAVRWTPDGGWTGREGKARSTLAFGLLDLRREDPRLEAVSFESVAQITVRNDVLSITQELPLDDEAAIVTPLALAKVVSVDGSMLDWKALSEDSDLAFVSVKLKAGSRSFANQLKPRIVDGQTLPPESLFWLVPRGVGVSADIRFTRDDGSEIAWKHNGKNLATDHEEAGDLIVNLLNADWRSP